MKHVMRHHLESGEKAMEQHMKSLPPLMRSISFLDDVESFNT